MATDLSHLHTINRNAIDELIRRYSEASNNHSIADVVLANAEFTGRLLVNLGDTPMQGYQLAQTLIDHLTNTLKAGYAAKGYNTEGH